MFVHKYIKGQVRITAGAEIAAGDLVISGGIVGVAPYPISSGGIGVIDTEGQFTAVYDGGAAVSLGDTAYYNATSACVTNTSSGNTKIGVFTEPVTSGGKVCLVQIG